MSSRSPNPETPKPAQHLAARRPRDGMAVHFSSQTPEWPTPRWLFCALDREFGFTLDPCATHDNAKCAKHYTREDDGLRQSWRDEIVFMNSPYGREIAKWMAKAHYAAMHERATVKLAVPFKVERLPSEPDNYWSDLRLPCVQFTFPF